MELNIIEEKKNRMVFELKGTDHTVCNPLKKELYNDESVKISTYSIEHPLISAPKIILETDGNETPKEALLKAVQRLKKTNDRFRKEFNKEVR